MRPKLLFCRSARNTQCSEYYISGRPGMFPFSRHFSLGVVSYSCLPFRTLIVLAVIRTKEGSYAIRQTTFNTRYTMKTCYTKYILVYYGLFELSLFPHVVL